MLGSPIHRSSAGLMLYRREHVAGYGGCALTGRDGLRGARVREWPPAGAVTTACCDLVESSTGIEQPVIGLLEAGIGARVVEKLGIESECHIRGDLVLQSKDPFCIGTELARSHAQFLAVRGAHSVGATGRDYGK